MGCSAVGVITLDPSALPVDTGCMTEPTQPAPVVFLEKALPDLDAWTRYFRTAQIPVRTSTAAGIERLRERQDEDVDAHSIAEVVAADPLMIIKVLAHVASIRPPGHGTATENVTTSLVLLGIAPFFRAFGLQPTIKDWMHGQPAAIEGLRALIIRAQRAARFALGFAVHRQDADVDAIRLAAYLHDFAEMLMWCHAPTLMQRIALAQRADSTLRSAVIQREVLNMEIVDLRQNLMKIWHLPELLVRISDDRHADAPSVRCVVLAQRLARHTAKGWDNAAVPDDINDIAELLNALPRVALGYVRKIENSG